ncbi:AtpZ/AtpI family protein [candidate division KSB1 bacterium]|nr:AtpZ/AtpI family protein [candidate division KSB1 bacterium]
MNSPNPQSEPPSEGKPGRRKFTEPPRNFLRDPLQIGVSIVGVTVVFGGGGWWLDSKLGSFPVFLFVGSVLGLFGSIYSIVVRLRVQDSDAWKKSHPRS